jgi:hypothetical protein
VTITGDRGTTLNGPIGTLYLTAALGDTLITPLRIDEFAWTDGVGRVLTKDGLVRIKPLGGWRLYVPDGRLTLLPPRPNPTSGPTEVIYETIESGRTRLYLVNLLGERLQPLVDAEVSAGRYQLLFDPAGYAAGNYFLVLETPTGRLAQPMQIEH